MQTHTYVLETNIKSATLNPFFRHNWHNRIIKQIKNRLFCWRNKFFERINYMKEIKQYNENIFEGIKHVNEFGQEFWLARELQPVLKYTEWRNFLRVIDKAKEACTNSGNQASEHFVDVNKTSAFLLHYYIRWLHWCSFLNGYRSITGNTSCSFNNT